MKQALDVLIETQSIESLVMSIPGSRDPLKAAGAIGERVRCDVGILRLGQRNEAALKKNDALSVPGCTGNRALLIFSGCSAPRSGPVKPPVRRTTRTQEAPSLCVLSQATFHYSWLTRGTWSRPSSQS